MINVDLKLLTIAVETAADVIAAIHSLLELSSFLNSARLLLFESACTKLKFQLETYLLKLMKIVAQE